VTVTQSANVSIQDQLEENPYPLYAQWRRGGPVMWVDPPAHWFVTGHREAMAALREPRLVSPSVSDPAAHLRRRSLAQEVFTLAYVEQFRLRAYEVADTLLAQAANRGGLDLVKDFGSPLAMSVAADMFGLPAEDRPAVSAWVGGQADGLAPPMGHCRRLLPGGVSAPVGVPEAMLATLADIVAARRKEPGDDLVSQLCGANGQSGSFDDTEVLELFAELLFSAHNSTIDLIGNGMQALLDNTSQLDRLRAEPELITTGVEELLRYDAPIQMITRRPTEDTELAGKTLLKGQTVIVMVGAANRDPEVFEGPDLLDLSRTPNHHLTFGRGPRMCLGAPFARVIGQVAIGSLVARFPSLRPAGPAVRRKAVGGRGFTSLPMAL
jgi:cytochrome P450